MDRKRRSKSVRKKDLYRARRLKTRLSDRFESLETRLLLAGDTVPTFGLVSDQFEPNNDVAMASNLGVTASITVEGAAITADGALPDSDFYRFSAVHSGVLVVSTSFSHDEGDLALRAYDGNGSLVDVINTSSNIEKVALPVVAGESYIVEVYGVNGATNSYTLSSENLNGGIPQAITLDPNADTGRSHDDGLTGERRPRFTILADTALFQEYDLPALDMFDATDATSRGWAVFVTIRNGENIVDSGYATPLGDDLFTYRANELTPGLLVASASIHVFDVHQGPDPEDATVLVDSPVVGSSLESVPATFELDTEPPTVTSPKMLPSSDSGMSRTDNVTNVMDPAFAGEAGVNDHVRIFSNGLLVGEAFAGIAGRWEITVEPHTDGIYFMTTQVTDPAGNSGDNAVVLPIEIDTIPPNTPFLDLTDDSDTGIVRFDNITHDDTFTLTMTTTDANASDHLSEYNFKYRLYLRPENGPEALVYSSVDDDSIPDADKLDGFTRLEFITTTLPELPDGTHNFKLEVEDRAGNISEDFLLDIELDTILEVPDFGLTLDLLDISDSGMSNQDNVTQINRPAFSGIAEVGAMVSIYANGRLVGETTVGSDETDFVPGDGLGAWETTTVAMADGLYDVVIHVEDVAGNFLRSESLVVEVDTTAPNTPLLDLLNDTGHADYDDITGESVLRVNLTTSDPQPIGGHQNAFNYKYRIYARTAEGTEELVYNSVTDPNIADSERQASFTNLEQIVTTIGPFADGVHNFKLEVEDRAGNISEDFLLNVQVDSTLDGVPGLALLPASDTGMFSDDNVTSVRQPTFIGNSEVGSTVRLRANGILVGIAEVQSDDSDGVPNDGLGQWTVTSAPLRDGTYRFTAEVEDWAGNVEETGAITVEIDTLAPNTPQLDLMAESDTGCSQSDEITFDVDPTFNMATIDPNANQHASTFNYKYRLFARYDSGEEQLIYDSSADAESFTPSTFEGGFTNLENIQHTLADIQLLDGVHNFKLEVEDRAGNISVDTVLDVKIDTVLDSLTGVLTVDMLDSSDTGMSDRDNVTHIRDPQFFGMAEVGAAVSIFANGRLVGSGHVGSDETDFVSGNGIGAWSVTIDALDDGVYEVLAHIEDKAGNFMRTTPIVIEVDGREPNTPYLDLLNDDGHSDHDDITGQSELLFNMTTHDSQPDGGHINEYNFKYRIFLRPEGGEERLVYNSVVDSTIDVADISEGFTRLQQLTTLLEPLPDGIHNFKLEVEDRAGNISHDFLLNVQIDSEITGGDPTLDLLPSSDTGMSDEDNITALQQPAFGGVSEMGSTIRLRANGLLVGETEVHSDDSDGVPGDGLGEWEITSEPLDDGIYEITAEVEDWTGNIRITDPLIIEIDSIEPNTPYLDLVPNADSGLFDHDEVTNVLDAVFNMATLDPNQANHLREYNYKFRLFIREDSGSESLIYSSATDAANFDPSEFQDGFTNLDTLQRLIPLDISDGVHNFKLEVEDRAGNISHDFLLNVRFDTILELPNGVVEIDLRQASDTGMGSDDNVTNIDQPTFTGVAEIDATVTLIADGIVIGTAKVGSDETNSILGDGLGGWEITVDPLDDGIYEITALIEDLAGNNQRSEIFTIEIDTVAPNTPFLDLVAESDSGIGGRDDVTFDDTLTFNMTTTDPAPEGHLIAENYKFRLYVRPENGGETLVFNSVDAFADTNRDGLTVQDFITATLDQLPEGKHNFKLEVEDRAGNISEDFLLDITIDRTLLPPTIDLIISSDSGMSNIDNVTNIRQPTFSGLGDVGDRVSLFANGILIGGGFVGSDETDFVPGDGRGVWQVTTQILNDGVYEVIAHVEDEAGNFQRTTPISIEIDGLSPNTPHLDLVTSSDTGHSDHDNITFDATPTFTFTTEDPNHESHLNQFNFKYRLYLRPEGGEESLVYNSVVDPELDENTREGSFTNLLFLERTLEALPDGKHNFKLEVEDRAGNISTDFLLNVEIDTSLPLEGDVALLESSDSGMSNTDHVTNKDMPAFSGTGTPGTQVRLYANGEFVGTTEVGSDQSDGVLDDGRGLWEITSEPLVDDVYEITATFEDWAGNISNSNSLQIEVDTLAPNTPFLDLVESTDSGRHNDDNITNADTLSLSATTEDPNSDKHLILFPDGQNLKYRIFDRPESDVERLIYESATDDDILNKLDGLTSLNHILTDFDGLEEGIHNFKLEVEDRAGNISHDFLFNVLIDRVPFEGTVTLHPDSDTGIWGIDETFGDGITGTSEPLKFTGVAEANNVITLFVNGELAGTTVALPFDGDEAFQTSRWELVSTIAIPNGTQDLVITFEDVAGNESRVELADDFVFQDTLGPRIENVTRDDDVFTSIFDPKPAGGPDPLIDAIVVHFSDGPDRPAGLDYAAVLEPLALEEGNYQLVGDANGHIPIRSVSIIGQHDGPGKATTAVRLEFVAPLPDDRFTLSVSDRISDAAGNPLDGESGASGPFEGVAGVTGGGPNFPTGDGNHGGDFQARFTIDSRPEIGVWSAGSVYIDINGDFLWDITNRDFVNRDITYSVGFTSDDVFAGNFAGPNGIADGYDKLAAYGRYGGWVDGTFRWLVDLDNDGVIDIAVNDPADVNGLPVAGEFDGNVENGDEVALFTGEVWHFDTNGDYLVDTQLESELQGYPIVGDFDGDGFDDLGTWTDDVFMIDLARSQNGWDGVADASFRFGFIGVRERPVAADMDQDGFEDLGLWVPDRGGITAREAGEWYWIVSGGQSVFNRIVAASDPVRDSFQEVLFRPIPFGVDIFAQFGDEFAIPVVGNFDPPTLALSAVPSRLFTNPIEPFDVNADGNITARDVLTIINHINIHGPGDVEQLDDGADFLDVNGDGFISARDVLNIVNYLNDPLESDLDEIAADVAQAAMTLHDDAK